MGLFDPAGWWNADENGNDGWQPTAIFEFESGTLCGVCGKYHADQWQCDPSIPNPWGGEEEP